MQSRPEGPYFVLGTGRCGTSTVARILHEHFKIPMALDEDRLRKFHHTNPDGAYEDWDIYNMNRWFIDGKIGIREWLALCDSHILARKRKWKGQPWGWKDIPSTTFMGLMLLFFDEPPRIIRCMRDRRLVLKSMVKNFVQTRSDAEYQHDSGIIQLDRILQYIPHLVIDFGSEQRSDEWVIKQIEERWPDIWGN